MLVGTLLCLAGIYACFLLRINALYPAFALAISTPIVVLVTYLLLAKAILLHVFIPLVFVWVYYIFLSLCVNTGLFIAPIKQTIKEFGRYVNPHVVKEWVALGGFWNMLVKKPRAVKSPFYFLISAVSQHFQKAARQNKLWTFSIATSPCKLK